MTVLNVYTDGGARGNPGPAAIGVVVKDKQGKIVYELGRTIGAATNNVAEYQAVIDALQWLKLRPKADRPLAVNFYSDSTLIVHQIKGEWKIKQAHLKQLFERVHWLENNLTTTYTVIPREQNSPADALVNQALDKC